MLVFVMTASMACVLEAVEGVLKLEPTSSRPFPNLRDLEFVLHPIRADRTQTTLHGSWRTTARFLEFG